MYKLKNSLIAFAGLAALIGVTALVTPKTSYSQGGNSPKDVNVVNTPGVNVANTPNVNIINSPTVQAEQSGAWTVGIEGTPTVKVDTTLNPLLVRDVDNPAGQPFQAFKAGNFNDGGLTTGSVLITTVPAGKRLVIEHVSVIGSMLPGQKMIRAAAFVSLQGSADGNPVPHFLTISAQGSTSGGVRDCYAASGQVRLYADPGTTVEGLVERDSTVGVNGGAVLFSISGHLVDLPQPVEQQ